MMIPESDPPSNAHAPQASTPARRAHATGVVPDQRRDPQPRESRRRSRDSAAMTRGANMQPLSDPWLAYTTLWQTSANECASQSLANWLQPVFLYTQHEAQWFEESYRAFTAWCAWWQASFGIPPAATPFATT